MLSRNVINVLGSIRSMHYFTFSWITWNNNDKVKLRFQVFNDKQTCTIEVDQLISWEHLQNVLEVGSSVFSHHHNQYPKAQDQLPPLFHHLVQSPYCKNSNWKISERVYNLPLLLETNYPEVLRLGKKIFPEESCVPEQGHAFAREVSKEGKAPQTWTVPISAEKVEKNQ